MKEMKARSSGGRAGIVVGYGNFVFRYRNLIFPISLVAMLVFYRPVFAFGVAWADISLDLIGLAVGLAGVILRAAVVGIAYIKRGGRNRRVAADRLVSEGMFAHCRNPLYVGNMLIIAGVFLIANNTWLYLTGGTFFMLSYAAMVAAEERYLLAKFGEDYLKYSQRVPRWRIDFRGLWATLTQGRIDWRRIVVMEYTSIGVWILMNLAVFGYEEFVNEPLADSRNEIVIAMTGMALTGLMVGAIRTLKKNGWFSNG